MGIIVAIVLIAIDQITKSLAVKYLMGQKPKILIDNFLELHFVKNYGAAFGILQNQRWLFILITIVVLILLVFYTYQNKMKLTRITQFTLWMLIGGAIGNLIDRVKNGYVVDFIRVNITKDIDFPVFNFADVFIVLGTALLILIIIFNKYEIEDVKVEKI